LSWLGVTLGLGLHTLIDGVTLGADVAAQVGAPSRWPLYGFGTFLAILLHKPLDAVSITSLMATGGWSATWRNAVNAGFALMCPLGAVAFLVGVRSLVGEQGLLIGCALGFSAGVFLCISLGDLLPELEMHSHHRLQLSAALLAGVGLAWLIEQAHQEGHAHAPPADVPAAGAEPEP
jgi:zinc and cadmium transporter